MEFLEASDAKTRRSTCSLILLVDAELAEIQLSPDDFFEGEGERLRRFAFLVLDRLDGWQPSSREAVVARLPLFCDFYAVPASSD